MNRTLSTTALALTGVLGLSIITPVAASASEEGKRNTAIGIAAHAAALLLTQKSHHHSNYRETQAYDYQPCDTDGRARIPDAQYRYGGSYQYDNEYRNRLNSPSNSYFRNGYGASRQNRDNGGRHGQGADQAFVGGNRNNSGWSNHSSSNHSHQR